jgi:nitrile hydratase
MTFAVGEVVQTREPRDEGHTRLPRYLARRRGRIEAVHGAFLLPDEHARGVERAVTLYTVRFDAREVFGAEHAIFADLFEPYLEASP